MLETETYINRKFFQNQINMENDVLKAIKERRSIRRFKADQITDEELKTVLEAGTWAATGHGTQKPFIVAVQNRKHAPNCAG